VGGRSLAFYSIRFDLWKDLDEKHVDVNMSKHPLLLVSKRNLLLVMSRGSTHARRLDSLTNSSPPYRGSPGEIPC
jgi:hypothetical protein